MKDIKILPGRTGTIVKINKFSTHDGPGIRTTVFLKGCPLRCKWCSNPETQKSHIQLYYIAQRCEECGACQKICPTDAISMDKDNKVDRQKCSLCMQCVETCLNRAFEKVGRKVTVAEVVGEVAKDIPFYGKEGGVTISGGEPFFQPDFTIELLKKCREKGISTVIDTSGYADKKAVGEALQYTDLILLDIKHMNPQKHKKGTGVSNEIILENAKQMAEKTKVRISLPLIPEFNDDRTNLKQLAGFAKSIGVEWIDINPLHSLGDSIYRYLGLESPYNQFKPINPEKIREAVDIMDLFGLKTTVGRMM